MTFTQLPSVVRRNVKENSSLLLSIGAGIGVLSTAYLTGRASFQAAWVLHEDALDPNKPSPDMKEMTKRVWKLYIPAGISATATIVCIVGVKRVGGRKTLAAQTALAVSQRAYESYRAQVVDELGERKDKTFLAKVAEDRVTDNPPSSVIVGSGTVLCYELFTGRYFNSDMESLNRAVNEVNAKLIKHDYATLDDFYYLIGLENTMSSGQSGWESGKLLELEFSSVLSQGRPCLAFGYNYVKSF